MIFQVEGLRVDFTGICNLNYTKCCHKESTYNNYVKELKVATEIQLPCTFAA